MARRTYPTLPLSDAALDRVERAANRVAGEVTFDAQVAGVTELSRLYTRERSRIGELPSSDLALHARLSFFFVRDLPKIFGPLDELRRRGALREARTLRLLDVGAGLGATTFGVARWLRLRGLSVERLEVVALERNARALRAMTAVARVLAELPEEFVPVTIEARGGDATSLDVRESFDLATFGFVLNEMFAAAPEGERVKLRAELLVSYARHLRDDGAMVILEPALRESARELMAVRDELVARAVAPYVVAPCLHTRGCPMLPSERDWCHQELAYALPPRVARVARAASLRYEGLSYASLALANRPAPTREADDSRSFRVVSDRLESKGKLELFGCGDPGYVRLTQLTRKASDANAAFREVRRGDVLTIGWPLESAGRIDERTKVTKNDG